MRWHKHLWKIAVRYFRPFSFSSSALSFKLVLVRRTVIMMLTIFQCTHRQQVRTSSLTQCIFRVYLGECGGGAYIITYSGEKFPFPCNVTHCSIEEARNNHRHIQTNVSIYPTLQLIKLWEGRQQHLI